MPFYNWSTTAANNATSDPTCPFPEGMAPSAVNDGVRGAMARLREFGNDISGSIVTTGSSTAYAVSSNQGFASLTALGSQIIAFTPHATCGATVTLNVDGLGAQPLRTAPGVELLAGTIIQGTPYTAVYNAAAGAFYLHAFFGNPYNIPIGGMMPFLSTTAPNSSFVLPYGQAISRATYATLFAMTGTAFGSGDGSTTFNVPDLRGRSIFGLDTMGGAASGRLTAAGSGVDGTIIGANGGSQNYTMQRSDLPNVQPSFTGAQGSVSVTSTAGNVLTGNGIVGGLTSGGGNGLAPTNSAGSSSITSTGTLTPQGTVQSLNGGVAQTAQKTMPPAIIVPWILRVI